MAALTPYAPFDQTLNQILGLFNPLRSESGDVMVQPRMDVWARENAFVITVELPGVKKQNIEVSVSGNEVTIGAQMDEIKENEKAQPLALERRFGKISRSVILPNEVDERQSQAKYVDGVLELVLPFNQNLMPKKLAIK